MIPNKIFFIYLLKENSPDFPMVNYLCVKSAIEVNKPDMAIMYYDKHQSGPWWEKLKSLVTMVKLDQSEVPEEIFGNPIVKAEHKSDVIRLRKLMEHGGIYLDTDILCREPFTDLLTNKMVIGIEGRSKPSKKGRQGNLLSCNAVLMAEMDSEFLVDWFELYRSFNNIYWNRHSARLSYKLWKDKYAGSDLVTMLDERAFYHFGYDREGISDLFDNYVDLETGVYCHHLWDKLAKKQLSRITPEYLQTDNSTVGTLLRRFADKPDLIPVSQKSSYLNDFFDEVVFINMDKRPERCEEVKRQLDSVGLRYRRFAGIEKEHGYQGCTLSHNSVVQDASDKGLNNILIFEDDFFFHEYDDDLIKKTLMELPEDWDIVYFGGIPAQSFPFYEYSENLLDVSGVWCTFAYAINAKCFDSIKDHVYPWMKKGKCTTMHKYIDNMIAMHLTPIKNVFHVTPMLCRPNLMSRDSDIQPYDKEFNAPKMFERVEKRVKPRRKP